MANLVLDFFATTKLLDSGNDGIAHLRRASHDKGLTAIIATQTLDALLTLEPAVGIPAIFSRFPFLWNLYRKLFSAKLDSMAHNAESPFRKAIVNLQLEIRRHARDIRIITLDGVLPAAGVVEEFQIGPAPLDGIPEALLTTHRFVANDDTTESRLATRTEKVSIALGNDIPVGRILILNDACELDPAE